MDACAQDIHIHSSIPLWESHLEMAIVGMHGKEPATSLDIQDNDELTI